MYSEGDLVTVKIKNVKVVQATGTDSFRGIQDHVEYSVRSGRKENELFFSSYGILDGDIEVELVKRSTEIKPKPGDVYRTEDGEIWYARKYEGRTGTVVIENGDGISYSDDKYNIRDEIEQFKNKRPVLIVRDGRIVNS